MAGDVQQQRSWKCLEGEPDHYFAITIIGDGRKIFGQWRRKRMEKEKGKNNWRRKLFGQRKKWRKRGKTRHLKQGPEQEPSSPNQNDMTLITSTWSSGQSKAPESWARTARMSMANGAHEILLNKMDLGGGYLKLSLLRWSFASWLTICLFTFSYSCPPEVLRAREDRLAQLQGLKNDDDVTSTLKMTTDGDDFLFFLDLCIWSWWRWGKPSGQHEHPRRVKVRKRQEN